jgi:hypothetical protein
MWWCFEVHSSKRTTPKAIRPRPSCFEQNEQRNVDVELPGALMQADAGFHGGNQDAMEVDSAGEGGKRHIQVIDGFCRREGAKYFYHARGI